MIMFMRGNGLFFNSSLVDIRVVLVYYMKYQMILL